MNLSDLQFIFNRALSLTFIKKKMLLVFVVLALCGVLVVFFRGVAIYAGQWIGMSFTFLPFFLCSGFLFSLGIVLTRIYHHEIKKAFPDYLEIITKSWEVAIGSSYFAIAIILSYLVLWIALGIFVLLKEIPAIGDVFAVILVFGPFLLNLASLALCIFNFLILFFVTPLVALKGNARFHILPALFKRIKLDIFSHGLLAFFSLPPLLLTAAFLLSAAYLTGTICYTCENPLHNVLQWFFIMIPFTALLSPAVIFFFNFAAESHVLMQKILIKKDRPLV